MDSSDFYVPSNDSRLLSGSEVDFGGEKEEGDEENPFDVTKEDVRQDDANADAKEERLRHDLFILKKINASLGTYREALQHTQSASEHVAAQLEQTDALLNRYMSMLSKSEVLSRLIFDEHFEGGQRDDEVLEHERQEARRWMERKAREREAAEKREEERLDRLRVEKAAREEKERREREAQERMGERAAVRGVRGTRASMRATRGRGQVSTGIPRGHRKESSAARARA